MGKNARERKARRSRALGFDLDSFLNGLPEPTPVPPVDDVSFPEPALLLERVINHYLTSREFNGLPVGRSSGTHDNAARLLRDGLVQLVTNTDYMNTHIRPWVRDDVKRQEAELSAVAAGEQQGCLYPTSKAMAAHRPPLTAPPQPFRDRLTLAQGGTLDCAFFELAAVEGYLNDPAFECTLGDDGFRFADAADNADNLAFEELAVLSDAGYAYDHTSDLRGKEPIKRYWAAFLGDLADLPPKHQQRLQTYEVQGSDIRPHPIWYRRQMGHWPEHIGPFHKVILEMETINELWNIVFGANLFKAVDRPPAWGWVLRPTTGAWNAFILETAKLLLENLSTAGLDAAGAPTENGNGDRLGTLRRLEALLVSVSSPDITHEVVKGVLAPLDDIRKQRQAPAHKITTNAIDPLIINRQRDLLADLAGALEALRHFVAKHPKVAATDWQPSKYLDQWLSL